MATNLIGITPLQFNPRNAMLDVDGLVRGLNDYRRGAIEARQTEEIGRAGQMSPEAGYRHLMSVGLPDHARAVGLYPLQRDALASEAGLTRARTVSTLDENARARAMAPYQRMLAMQQYRQLIQQGRLTEAQAVLAGIQGTTARTTAETQQRFINQLLGGDPTTPGVGSVGLGLWNPLLMTPPTTLPPGQ